MLLIRMPGDAAGEMGADVREYPHFTFVFTQNKYAVTYTCPFPAVYFGAREFKQRGNPDRIFFERAEIDDRFIFRFAERGREQIGNRGKANCHADQPADKSCCDFDEVAAVKVVFICHSGFLIIALTLTLSHWERGLIRLPFKDA